MTLHCTTAGDLVAVVCWCRWWLAGPDSCPSDVQWFDLHAISCQNVGRHFCARSPCVHRTPWRALYGRWEFLRDTGGVNRIGKSTHYFLIASFNFTIILGVKSAFV